MSSLFYLPKAVRVDSVGSPYTAARAHFFLTGTFTETDVYSDADLTTPHSNPVVADASTGQFAPIYLDPAVTYRCKITDSDSVLLDDVDPVFKPVAGIDITVADAGGYFAASTVEDIFADIGKNYLKKSRDETITGNILFSSAELNLADDRLRQPLIKDFAITHQAYTPGATRDLDLEQGNSFAILLSANLTITISNPPITGRFAQIVVAITQDGAGGAYTVTWPASVIWPGGSAPTMSTGNDAVDIYTLFTIDAGTTWYGNFGQAYA